VVSQVIAAVWIACDARVLYGIRVRVLNLLMLCQESEYMNLEAYPGSEIGSSLDRARPVPISGPVQNFK